MLYLYLTPTPEEEKGTASAEPDSEATASFTCYEDSEAWRPVLEQVRFWVEGVALSALGVVGILGEIKI